MRQKLATTALVAAVTGVAACTTPTVSEKPTTVQTTEVHERLVNLPPAKREPTAAVYRYPDRTGKHKPNENYASYSRAVSQGASAILIKALNDAGSGDWFDVVPRNNLQDVIQERKIIRQVMAKNEQQPGTPRLPDLKYAGVIFEGGIIGFDANTMTGGIGAKYLGIGADTQYRKDTVTVYLHATSTSSGELLHSVQARKTIFSYGVNGSVFKFVAFKELLEAEAGFTNNEPNMLALRQAVEEALYAMIVEGAKRGLWRFRSEEAQDRVIQAYDERKAREFKSEKHYLAAPDAEENDGGGLLEGADPKPDI